MYFIGIDLGTSSVKLMLMDEKEIHFETTRTYPVHYPKPLWAEQDPLDWWDSTLDGLKEIFSLESINSSEIKSIGFSGQMHGLVTLDKENNILNPAILWCDQRTQTECDLITDHFGSNLGKFVGNKALTGFTAPKVLWLKNNKPQVFAKIEHILLPKDYIRFKLSGDYATDYSDASGMLLLDVEHKCYSKEMLDYLGIKEKQLPKLYESYDVTGKISEDIKAILGIKHDVIIVGGAGDQAAGAVGSGTVDSGIVSVTLGTSGVVFAAHNLYKMDEEKRLHAFCHANGKYHSMGVMLSAANSLQWWVDTVKSSDFETLLGEVDDEITEIQFLPYLMGERTPYADPNAKANFFGMTMTTNRKDMTKAVLEGVAFGLKDSLDLLELNDIPVEEIRLLGGGAKSSKWKQIIADVFGKSVYDINTNQGGALGAGILAAVGAGAFDTVEEAANNLISTTKEYKPNMDKHAKYQKKHVDYTALYQALKHLY